MKNCVTFALCVIVALTAGQVFANAYNDAVMGEASLITYHNFNGATGVNGSAIADEMGVSDGSFLSTKTVTSASNAGPGAGDYVQFTAGGGVLELGKLGSYGSSMASGATLEFWANCDGYSEVMGITFSGTDWRANTHQVRMRLDYQYGVGLVDDHIRFYQAFQGNASNPYTGAQARDGGTTQAMPGIADGGWSYIAVVTDVNADSYKFYTANAQTGWAVQEFSGNMDGTWVYDTIDFQYDWILGGTRTTDTCNFNGALDEVATYSSALSIADMQAHVNAMPEPSTLAMLFCMGLGLFVARRR